MLRSLVIVGPTASGKSDLAMRIAREFDGEIICADSRTVYKGMDIGTAKPSKTDQKLVRHWGLDLVEPGQRFTAADFQKYAKAAIEDIRSRGKLPILVGGSGLYIDGVIFDFGFSSKEAKRDPVNPRHLSHEEPRVRQKLKPGTLIAGIMPPDEVLKVRIAKRAEHIFKAGVMSETKSLVGQYGKESLGADGGIVYKICLELIAGKVDEAEALEKFKIADWQYARRQKTWFKRNKFIHWFESARQAESYVNSQLNN